MKKIFTLFFVLTCAYCNQALANSLTEKIQIPEHHFSVSFYDQPEYSLDTNITESDTLLSHYWTNKVSDSTHPNSTYSVWSEFYSPTIIHSDSSIESISDFILSGLDEYRENNEYSIGATIPLELFGYPGKQFVIVNKREGYTITRRQYLIANQLLTFEVWTSSDFANNVERNEFFESVELFGVKPGNYKLPNKNVMTTYLVDFPFPPTTKQEIAESEDGITYVIASLSQNEDTTASSQLFMIIETQLPESYEIPTDNINLNTFYNESIKKISSQFNAEVDEVRETNIHGKYAKEYILKSLHNPSELFTKIIYLDKKMYALIVVSKSDLKAYPERDKFINSFKIVGYSSIPSK